MPVPGGVLSPEDFEQAIEIARAHGRAALAERKQQAAAPAPAEPSALDYAKTLGENLVGGALSVPATVLGSLPATVAESLGVMLPETAQSVRDAASAGALSQSLVGIARGEEEAQAYGEAARGRAEAMPWTAAGGRLAGGIAGMALTGGAGGIAEGAGAGAAKLAGTGTAGALANAAASGAVYGGVFGAQGAQDEAFLQQRRLTGEQFLFRAGVSGLLGGALSVGVKAAGMGLSAGVSRLAGRLEGAGGKAATEGVAAEAGAGAEGAAVEGAPSRVAAEPAAMRASVETEIASEEAGAQKAFRALTGSSDKDIAAAFKAATKEEASPKMPEILRDVVGGKNVRERILTKAVEDVTPAMNEAQTLTRQLTDAVDDRFGWKAEHVAANIAGIDQKAAVNGTRALLQAQRQELWDAMEQVRAIGNVPKIAEQLDHQLVRTLQVAAKGDAAELYVAQDQLRAFQLRAAGKLAQQARSTLADEATIGHEMQKIVGGQYDQNWQALMDEGLWGAQGGAQRGVNEARVLLINAERKALPAFFQTKGTAYEGLGIARPVFEAEEGKIWSGLDSMTVPIRGAAVRRNLERWIDATAQFGDAMKRYGVAAEDASKMSRAADTLRTVFNRVGEHTKALEQAERFVNTHSAFGEGALGGVTNSAVRIKQAITIEHTATRAADEVRSTLDSFFERMAPAAERVREGAGRAVGRMRAVPLGTRGALPSALAYLQGGHATPEAGYRARAQEVIDMNRDGGEQVRTAAADAIGRFATKDPALAMSLVGTATRAAQFLQSKLPTPLHDVQSYTPMSSRPTPSRTELEKFARYFQAVDKPATVLRDLANGTATHDQIEALRSVYPEVYQDIRQQTLERLRKLDERGDTVPFRQQMLLDSLLDLNGAGNPILKPEFGAKYGPQIAAGAAQQAPPPPRSGGGKLKLGDRLATPTNTMIGGSS